MDAMHRVPGPLAPDFFAIPGVAKIDGSHFLVYLGSDQVFKARQDHLYVLGYKIAAPIDKLYPNPEREFIMVLQPVGTESLTVEVHFPPSRDLRLKDNGDLDLDLQEVRGHNLTQMAADRYRIDVHEKIRASGPTGNETEMFRLTIANPPQDANILIAWYWKKRPES